MTWSLPDFISCRDLVAIHLSYKTDFASKLPLNFEQVQNDKCFVAKKYVVKQPLFTGKEIATQRCDLPYYLVSLNFLFAICQKG